MSDNLVGEFLSLDTAKRLHKEKENKIDKNILEANIKLVEENERLQQQCKKQKEAIDKATNELFTLKDMIYKPETREENFEIQRKISSIIKKLNSVKKMVE